MSGKKAKTVERTFGLQTYLKDSRDIFNGIILVMPLFILYQIGVLATGGVRNGVDFISDVMWAAAQNDMTTYVLINVGILVVFGIALFFLRRNGTFKPKLYPFILGESSIYAMLLGTVIGWVMSTLGLDALLAVGGSAQFGTFTSLILSLGAGLYEEIVFRLVLMGGLFLLASRVFKLPTWVSAAGALVLSSLCFSAVHYIGSLGDTFTMGSFIFRFFAGAILAAIFYTRGFAVAVYTHAIYDVIVMIFH